MAFFASSYLQKRNGTFYFRRALPQDLQHKPNPRELVLSLRTNNPCQALGLLASCLHVYDLLIAQARRHKGMLNPNYKHLIRKATEEAVARSAHTYENALYAGQPVASEETLRDFSTGLEEFLHSSASFQLTSDPELLDLITFYGEAIGALPDTQGTDLETALIFLQRQLISLLLETTKAGMALRNDASFSPPPLPEHRPAVAATYTECIPTPKSPLITQAWQEYCKEKSGGWTINTRKAYDKVITEFSSMDFAGTRPVDEYSRDDLIAYRNKLKALPRNRLKLKEYRDLGVSEILQLDIPRDKLLKNRTINESLTTLSSFLTWCHKIKQYTSKDITHDVQLASLILVGFPDLIDHSCRPSQQHDASDDSCTSYGTDDAPHHSTSWPSDSSSGPSSQKAGDSDKSQG